MKYWSKIPWHKIDYFLVEIVYICYLITLFDIKLKTRNYSSISEDFLLLQKNFLSFRFVCDVLVLEVSFDTFFCDDYKFYNIEQINEKHFTTKSKSKFKLSTTNTRFTSGMGMESTKQKCETRHNESSILKIYSRNEYFSSKKLF